MKINSNKTKSEVKKLLFADDIIYFDFCGKKLKGFAVYVDSITDRENLGRLVLEPLDYYEGELNAQTIASHIYNANIELPENLKDAWPLILAGKTALFIDGLEKIIIVIHL